jgi:competence protein ComFA
MGHLRRCGRLIEVVEGSMKSMRGVSWIGQGFAGAFGLTVAQRDAVEGVRRAFRAGADALLWAVTGAGKTEMLFPLIAEALAGGQRVCVATPRRDVVLELVPRLRRAFPDVDIVELHGACADPYAAGPLVVATTHQLLRFRAAFDLLVVDELDAFPFAGSRTLARAARLAADWPAARRLWLTATPSPWLRLRARLRLCRLRLVRVPARFHGHPLPVPVPVAAAPQNLLAALLRSHQRGAQSFVFVPFVRDVAPLVDLLRTKLPAPLRVSGTSARDDQRATTVERFRANLLDVLVTTTILERGVTVPTVDVHVWHADARTFTATALVQIAGRAGRSAPDAPHATVTFYADEPTLAIARARRHIRATNRLAARRGYLR